jgi:hypothetical protein
MKINLLKKYYSLNILSLTGFLSLLFWVWGCMERMRYVRLEHAVGHDLPESYSFVFILILILLANVALLLLLLVSAVIEAVIRKKRSDIKGFEIEWINDKVYTFLFITGLILAPTPIYLPIFIYVVDKLVNTFSF